MACGPVRVESALLTARRLLDNLRVAAGPARPVGARRLTCEERRLVHAYRTTRRRRPGDEGGSPPPACRRVARVGAANSPWRALDLLGRSLEPALELR